MSTPAHKLKDFLDGATYTAYRSGVAPDVKIKGIHDLTTTPPNKGVLLTNKNEEPVFTFNNKKLYGNRFVEMEVKDPDPDERDNFITDLDTNIINNSNNITYSILGYNDVLSPYSIKIKVKLIN